jgi:hypothetical protein
MLEPLLAAWILIAWGAQAAAPWRAAALPPQGRSPWALAAVPLLASGALSAFRLLAEHPDAAMARGMGAFRGSPFALATALLFSALLLADLVAWLGGEKLEPAGWRLVALFGAAFLFAASFGGELLRIGETRPGPLWALFGLTACRFLIACGAGEAVAPGRPALAPFAALALLTYFVLLPQPVAAALLARQGWLPFGTATLLFAAARWLPQRLRRPALAAAALLAGLALTLAAELSRRLGTVSFP